MRTGVLKTDSADTNRQIRRLQVAVTNALVLTVLANLRVVGKQEVTELLPARPSLGDNQT